MRLLMNYIKIAEVIKMFLFFINTFLNEESRPAELPRQPLAEPDVTVSRHPAPIIQPMV